jgi:hypothetical protein
VTVTYPMKVDPEMAIVWASIKTTGTRHQLEITFEAKPWDPEGVLLSDIISDINEILQNPGERSGDCFIYLKNPDQTTLRIAR